MTKIMLKEFLEHIECNNLIEQNETVLLAVSGGIDSMSMASLFLEANFKFSIAHVNHNLRKEDSKKDAEFVQEFCLKQGITFHLRELDPVALKSGNLQANARNERYKFLEELADHFGYDKIATAHNRDDINETFFINLLRGTGLDGLDGISLKRGRIIRPLLFAARTDIVKYTTALSIAYREDESNQSTYYIRNKIRLQLTPVINEIDEREGKGIVNTIHNIERDNQLLKHLISQEESKYSFKKNQSTGYNLEMIFESGHGETLLLHFLKKYGFNFGQITEIAKRRNESGIFFYSEDHELLLDRKQMLVRKIQASEGLKWNETIKDLPWKEVKDGFLLSLELIDYFPGLEITGSDLCLDYDKIHFPLMIRNWLPGDKFKPLGLKGHQKVKDYLTNRKVDRYDKRNVLVILSENEIVAIPGFQISDSYRIIETTKKVIKITTEQY